VCGPAVGWPVTVSRSGGRGAAPAASRKVRTPQGKGAGESQDGVTCRNRATESRPPMAGGRRRYPAQARVKRCGKSAPASGATPAAGNPHPEQGQAWDGRPGRCPQVGRTDGWPPGGNRKGTAHRIRLIDRLTVTQPPRPGTEHLTRPFRRPHHAPVACQVARAPGPVEMIDNAPAVELNRSRPSSRPRATSHRSPTSATTAGSTARTGLSSRRLLAQVVDGGSSGASRWRRVTSWGRPAGGCPVTSGLHSPAIRAESRRGPGMGGPRPADRRLRRAPG
jgi:hypothetical protein